MSETSAKQMTWHKYGHRYNPDKRVHPSDDEAWKQFDRDFPEFSIESRNVWIAIATDGFNPFSMTAAPYSCWPVFVIPLNIPPGVLSVQTEFEFMFCEETCSFFFWNTGEGEAEACLRC
jgi:hypothetical protein